MYFPSRIDLSKWCSEKPSSNCEPEYNKLQPGNANCEPGNANYQPGNANYQPIFNCDCSFTNKKALFIDK
jgi:hypothetical protein